MRPQQRGQNAACRADAGDVVAHGNAQRHGRGPFGGHHPANAGFGPKRRRVEARLVALVTFKAEAGDAGINHFRVDGVQRVEIEALFFQLAGAHIGQEHIGIFHQLAHNIGAFIRRCVDGERALAAIVERENRIVRIVVRHGRGEEITHRAAAQRFNFDNLGAPIGHDATGGGCCNIGCHFNNFYAFEHDFLLIMALLYTDAGFKCNGL